MKTAILKVLILIVLTLFIESCNQTKKEKPLVETTQDFCKNIHRNNKQSLSGQLKEYDDISKKKTGVYVLEDGSGSLITRAWLSEYAEKNIDIQYFIFSTDNVGLIACDYLVRAADRGVKVRLLVDDFMVNADLNDILGLDSHPNIDIKIYNPGVNIGKNIFSKIKKFATDFRGANQRMHNKTFIVDNKIVITGGRNIADEYFDYDHEYNFRDRDVFLIGKETQKVNSSFELFWNDSLSVNITTLVEDRVLYKDKNFDNLHQYACNPENYWPQIRKQVENFDNTIAYIKNSGKLHWVEKVSFISDLPGKNDGNSGLGGGGISTTALIKLVKKAKESILIQTPYLITTDLSKNLFRKAIANGVSIIIQTNSLASTDNLEAFASYQKDRQELLDIGIEIYEFKPDAAIRKEIMTSAIVKKLEFKPIFGLHAKTMVIDKKLAVIGTFNLDPRSANLNTECFVVIDDNKIAEQVQTGIEKELLKENAWKISSEFNPDHLVPKGKQFKSWTRKILPKGIL